MEPLHLHAPEWFFRLLTAIPGLARGYWKFTEYCSQKLERRLATSPEVPDIFSALIETYRSKSMPVGDKLYRLQADSRLIIVAGSDTTAACLTYLFYHLASDTSRMVRLREELSPLVDSNGDAEGRKLQECTYLNGSINEALRLNPPVPSRVQRKTPLEGIKIGNSLIPDDTTAYAL